MQDRNVSGSLDLSWTSDLKTAQERLNNDRGEVVSGSSMDDLGESSTVVGSDSDSPLAKEIKRYRLCNPNATLREIADATDCDFSYVWHVFHGEEARYSREAYSELSESQQRIISLRREDPDRTQRSIAEEVGVSEGYVSRTLSNNEKFL